MHQEEQHKSYHIKCHVFIICYTVISETLYFNDLTIIKKFGLVDLGKVGLAEKLEFGGKRVIWQER